MNEINNILLSLQKGSSKDIREHTKKALEVGIKYKDILNAMLKTMEDVGEKFKKNIIFVPEVLIIGRAFNVALEEICPHIIRDNNSIGTVVIGTVQGDHHDVGKNIVKLFFESSNIRVIDLGVNVSPQTFIDEINASKPDVLALSALLTTTMIEMEKVITQIEEKNIRNNLKIIIGGAPITEKFALNIGADFYASNAYDAARIICDYLLIKQ